MRRQRYSLPQTGSLPWRLRSAELAASILRRHGWSVTVWDTGERYQVVAVRARFTTHANDYGDVAAILTVSHALDRIGTPREGAHPWASTPQQARNARHTA